ncbi:YqaJ viral recombinase family protein [Ruminococcus albus]|nr:YqaJ viral recombinase family protein [Ruminococcus albus]
MNMNAKVFADTSSMSREEWLKYRTMGIGGSDVSVIAGINPYRSVFQLWLEKTGQTEPFESGNECTHFGTVLEPIVKQEFTERTGIEIAEPKFIYQHPDYPFMFANLDGVVNVDGEDCIFEAKTASAYKQNEWNTGVPPEYMIQIQHYMAVTGLKKTYIAALIGGNHFVYKTVERDDEMIADIIEMERRFWEENVLGGEEPLPDGSEGTTSWLSEHYSESNGESVELPEDTVFICEEYEDISEQIEALSAEKDALGNRLKAMLKNNETGLAGKYRVSWKTVNSSRFDSTRFKAENPELYGKFVKQSSSRRFGISGGAT